MNITNDFDPKCVQCFDTGEYFNGKDMKVCSCDAGKKLKLEREKNDIQGGVSKVPKPKDS